MASEVLYNMDRNQGAKSWVLQESGMTRMTGRKLPCVLSLLLRDHGKGWEGLRERREELKGRRNKQEEKVRRGRKQAGAMQHSGALGAKVGAPWRLEGSPGRLALPQ